MRTLLALTCWTRRSHNPMRDPPGQRCPRRSEALALTSGLQNFSRARPVILYTFPDPDVLLLLSARRRLIALVYNFPCRGRTGSRLAFALIVPWNLASTLFLSAHYPLSFHDAHVLRTSELYTSHRPTPDLWYIPFRPFNRPRVASSSIFTYHTFLLRLDTFVLSCNTASRPFGGGCCREYMYYRIYRRVYQ